MKKGLVEEKNGTDNWLTPPALLKALGPFDLDPCACPNQPWASAANHYTLPESNGLLLPWSGRVWCNPPYGNETPKWINRMSLHSNGVMLVFARTETNGFRPTWFFGDALFFPYKRVSFFRPDGTPSDGGQAPSVLIAFGDANIEALRALKKTEWNGSLVTEWEP